MHDTRSKLQIGAAKVSEPSLLPGLHCQGMTLHPLLASCHGVQLQRTVLLLNRDYPCTVIAARCLALSLQGMIMTLCMTLCIVCAAESQADHIAHSEHAG